LVRVRKKKIKEEGKKGKGIDMLFPLFKRKRGCIEGLSPEEKRKGKKERGRRVR